MSINVDAFLIIISITIKLITTRKLLDNLFCGASKKKENHKERTTDIYCKYKNQCQKVNSTSVQVFEFYLCRASKVAVTNDAKVKDQHSDSGHINHRVV